MSPVRPQSCGLAGGAQCFTSGDIPALSQQVFNSSFLFSIRRLYVLWPTWLFLACQGETRNSSRSDTFQI